MATHHQCSWCHTIYEGPFKEQNPGHAVSHITDEGEMLEGPEREARGLPLNVSHGHCPEGTCRDPQAEEKRREFSEPRKQGPTAEEMKRLIEEPRPLTSIARNYLAENQYARGKIRRPIGRPMGRTGKR